ncbi:MAG: rhodanese-like domain-containing protein [Magnetococcales bacterium]|nr:rhodanese-like domain-containing protein [Magnetococcales bacterium]
MAWLQENGMAVLMVLIFLSLVMRGPALAWYYKVGSMSVHDLSQRLSGPRPVLLIDVRTPGEFSDSHVHEARSYPLSRLSSALPEIKKAAGDQDIAVICRSGNRSLMGSVVLKRFGLPKVYNVNGGMTHWEAQGYPVRRG